MFFLLENNLSSLEFFAPSVLASCSDFSNFTHCKIDKPEQNCLILTKNIKLVNLFHLFSSFFDFSVFQFYLSMDHGQ